MRLYVEQHKIKIIIAMYEQNKSQHYTNIIAVLTDESSVLIKLNIILTKSYIINV